MQGSRVMQALLLGGHGSRVLAASHAPAAGAQLRMSPSIAENDLNNKLRMARGFIGKGHRVRFTMQVRWWHCARPAQSLHHGLAHASLRSRCLKSVSAGHVSNPQLC